MRALTLCLLAGLASGCAGVGRLDLTTLGRGTWQRPELVVRALEIAPGARVADLGAGEGYFVPYLARAVGPGGVVYAVEVEKELSSALEERFAREGNVRVVLGEYYDPLLPDQALDLILIVNTYHHIEDREVYFQRLLTDLRPDGRIAVLEPNQELTGVLSLFLGEGHTSRASDIERELRAAGYRRVASHELLPVQIFEVYAASREVAALGECGQMMVSARSR